MRFARQKNPNILTLVLSGKKFLNETKNHNPPCKLNGCSLNSYGFHSLLFLFSDSEHHQYLSSFNIEILNLIFISPPTINNCFIAGSILQRVILSPLCRDNLLHFRTFFLSGDPKPSYFVCTFVYVLRHSGV